MGFTQMGLGKETLEAQKQRDLATQFMNQQELDLRKKQVALKQTANEQALANDRLKTLMQELGKVKVNLRGQELSLDPKDAVDALYKGGVLLDKEKGRQLEAYKYETETTDRNKKLLLDQIEALAYDVRNRAEGAFLGQKAQQLGLYNQLAQQALTSGTTDPKTYDEVFRSILKLDSPSLVAQRKAAASASKITKEKDPVKSLSALREMTTNIMYELDEDNQIVPKSAVSKSDIDIYNKRMKPLGVHMVEVSVAAVDPGMLSFEVPERRIYFVVDDDTQLSPTDIKNKLITEYGYEAEVADAIMRQKGFAITYGE